MITMGFFNQPRDDKVSDGGDDAWFITNSVISAFGVADGVGSWRVQGINAGHCAREIMKFSREHFIDGGQTPYESLEIAESKSKKLGSTTALVAYYHEGLKLLDVSQVGDCNLIVIRGQYVVHQTHSQVRYHDAPYQIGKSSNDTMMFHSKEYTFELKVGDVIVAGSDGLWDNMFPTQVSQIINNSGLRSAKQLANVVGTVAYELSKDQNMWSPFAQNAYEDRKIYDTKDWKGGKTDDITLVVAVVE